MAEHDPWMTDELRERERRGIQRATNPRVVEMLEQLSDEQLIAILEAHVGTRERA